MDFLRVCVIVTVRANGANLASMNSRATAIYKEAKRSHARPRNPKMWGHDRDNVTVIHRDESWLHIFFHNFCRAFHDVQQYNYNITR